MKADEIKRFNRELLKITVPLALQNLLNALVGASDALMLGRLTQDAIAAVSLANQISFVMSLLNGAVIGAVGVLVALLTRQLLLKRLRWSGAWSGLQRSRKCILTGKACSFSRRLMKRMHGRLFRGCWQAAFPGG